MSTSVSYWESDCSPVSQVACKRFSHFPQIDGPQDVGRVLQHPVHPPYTWLVGPPYFHLARDVAYHYNGAQRYEQFLQVGQLYRVLILFGLAIFRAPLYL